MILVPFSALQNMIDQFVFVFCPQKWFIQIQSPLVDTQRRTIPPKLPNVTRNTICILAKKRKRRAKTKRLLSNETRELQQHHHQGMLNFFFFAFGQINGPEEGNPFVVLCCKDTRGEERIISHLNAFFFRSLSCAIRQNDWLTGQGMGRFVWLAGNSEERTKDQG